MLENEYATMFAAEERHWWYQGLHDQVLRAVARYYGPDGPSRLLDAGCGTGRLLELYRGAGARGLDLSATALGFCRRRGLSGLVRASVTDLPYAAASFEAVVSLDVICNLDTPGFRRALSEFARVLAPGGRFFLNIVAFQWLYSQHDRAVFVKKRYRLPEIRRECQAAGLDPELLSYSNTALFPPAAAVRLARKFAARADREPVSDLRPLPGPLNAALAWVRKGENALIVDWGARLPFGLSVFGVFRKPPLAGGQRAEQGSEEP